MVTASPAKLVSGEWGARLTQNVSVGDVIQVRTKSGKEWMSRVAKIVWTGDGTWLVATSSVDEGRPTASTRVAAKRGPLASGRFQSRALRDPVAPEKMIHTSGRGGYEEGETFRAAKVLGGGGPDGCYWTVVACGEHRISQFEDDCREGEWMSDAIVRPATDAEWQPVAARIEAAAKAKAEKDAAIIALTAGECIGRDDPAGKRIRTMATETGCRSALSAASIIEYDSGIYHVRPVHDDSPCSTRLSASREQIEAAILASGWAKTN